MECSAVAGVGVRALAVSLLPLLLCPPQLSAQTHLVVVSGLGGDELHSARFHNWSTSILDAATTRFCITEANVTYLAERVERDP